MGNNAKILVGTSGWSYPDWRGRFYPSDWPKSRWFEYYCKKFSTVEVNATFYRFFKEKTYRNWYDKAPDNFEYVLKVPRIVTHQKYLKNAESQINDFWNLATLLKDKLGLVLLQLPPDFEYDPKTLEQAIRTFDDPRKVAVEFRDEQWFNHEIRDLLKELGAVFCSVDSPKSELRDWVTSDVAYIRLHGRKGWYDYNYSAHELREVKELTEKMNRRGAKKIYIFLNNDYDARAPKNAQTLMQILEE